MDSLLQSARTSQSKATESQEKKAIKLTREPLPEQAAEMKKMRTPRSRKYIKAIQRTIPLYESSQEMKEAVETLPVTNLLLGILSGCGIPGCIIHAVDKWGNIIQHYCSLEEMSPDLQEGYEVWQSHRGCTCVEIYTCTICVVYDDGSVKFIERGK